MITIIDYAVNNLNSVEKAFRSLKIPVEITDNTRKIREADKLVLPGVGAFGDAVNNLKTKKIFELVASIPTIPLIVNFLSGVVVPIPTLPPALNTNWE